MHPTFITTSSTRFPSLENQELATMKLKLSGLLLGLLVALSGGEAKAITIDYIFTGTGTGDLGGTPFNGNFNVTYIGGILSNIAPIGSFSTLTLNAVFDSGTVVNLNTDPAFPLIGFGQTIPPSSFVEEATRNSAFTPYNLASAFPFTAGTPSFLAQTYLTNKGNLDFSTISALSFQAATPGQTPSAVPLPPSAPLFAVALLGLGFVAYQRRRNGSETL
jgi:hypothetical protein